MLDLLAGRRRQGAVVNLVAAGAANAVAIFTVSTFASMLGTKTLKLKRLVIQNLGAGNTWLHIGTGVAGAFIAGIPALYSLSNTSDVYDEIDLPQREFPVTITAYPDAVGGGSFNVQVEVEECG